MRRCAQGLAVLAMGGLFVLQGAPLHRAVLQAPALSLLALAIGLVLVACPISWRLLIRLGGALYRLPPRTFGLGLILIVFAAYGCMAYDVFDAVPRLDDGVGSLFQARVFARGQLTLPLAPEPQFFRCFAVLGEDEGLPHRCGMYPPGWPALLTPGVWLGVPWLVNPLLGAALALVVWMLGRTLFEDRVGRTAALLTAMSPLGAALAGTHLSHTSTALALAVAWWMGFRLIQTGRTRYGLGAGLGWALAFLSRPLTALVVGAVLALALLLEWRQCWRAWRGILLALAVAALGAGLLLLFQYLTLGDAFTPGHEVGMGRRGKYGFVRLDHVRTHTVALGLRHTHWRVQAMNEQLMGWPVPAFVLMLAPFVLGRANRRHLMLPLPYIGLLAVFMPFWYFEIYFPGRYTFESFPMLWVLAAAGIHALGRAGAARGPRTARALAALAAAGVATVALVTLPAYFERFDARFGDVEGVLPKVVQTYAITNALVFMESVGKAPEEEDPANNYYATGFMRNDLDLRGDVLFARNAGDRVHTLIRHYPGRTYYLYRYRRDLNRAHLWIMNLTSNSLALTPVIPRCRRLMPPE